MLHRQLDALEFTFILLSILLIPSRPIFKEVKSSWLTSILLSTYHNFGNFHL